MKTAFSTALVALAMTAASAAHAQSGKDVIATQIQQAHQAWLTTRTADLAQAGGSGSNLHADAVTIPSMMTAAECKCPMASSNRS